MREKILVIVMIIFLLFLNIPEKLIPIDMSLCIVQPSSNFSHNSSNSYNLSKENINRILNNYPNSFIENQGQLENNDVCFYTQGGGLWFTNDGILFEIKEKINGKKDNLRNHFDPLIQMESLKFNNYKRIIIKQKFIGANPTIPIGKNALNYFSNFFYGNDSTKWHIKVLNYQEIYYRNLYDGIDLRYYFNDNGLKYDLILHPGADISQIKIRYEGAKELKIDKYGNLIIKTTIKDIVDSQLFIYQNYNGIQTQISGEFISFNDLEYGFKVSGAYQKEEFLIIDPLLVFNYSTFIGGQNSEIGYDISIDRIGNAYVTGTTYSSDFPTTQGVVYPTFRGGLSDIFLLKFNTMGSSILYSSFIGGNNFDYGYSITLDPVGNAIVTGNTLSSNFPTTPGAFDRTYNDVNNGDVFVFKMNKDGTSLIYSTFIGGDQLDRGRGITSDSTGNVIITGQTWSSNFPNTTGANDTTFNGNSDCFILELNHNGSKLNYSTFIGGNGFDGGFDIELDSLEYVLVTGYTGSMNFPATPGANDTSFNGGLYDVFVLKLNQNGSILNYSTYVGGNDYDKGIGIAVDSIGNVYVTGYTESSDFPTTKNAYDTIYDGGFHGDVFVIKLNQNGSTLLFSSYIGGENSDEGYDIIVDLNNDILVTGFTQSSNFPLSTEAFDQNYNGGDVFFLKLAPNGSTLIYSTFIGKGSGQGIAIDSFNDIFLTGSTGSSEFPTTQDAYCTTITGSDVVFVSKFSLRPRINITSVTLMENNNKTSIIYSRYLPYTFRINITDTASLSDLQEVKLILDTNEANIHLLWDRVTGNFLEIFDPNDYISVDPSSKIFSNSWEKWIIYFNITFNWTYSDENFHNIQIIATSAALPTKWLNLTDFYRVENDLVFNGILLVKDEDNRILQKNDLVRGGEILIWTGLKPVYEGTTNIYPKKSEFNITIRDETGISWSESPNSGEVFTLQTRTNSDTNKIGFIYLIYITGIPPECDKTNESFIIKIDSDYVVFSNPEPDNKTWHMDNTIDAGITISDFGGGFVNGSNIKYSVSTTNGTIWDNWIPMDDVIDASSIRAKTLVSFKEGRDNLIKWQAYDTLGNGPSVSEPYRILIDTEPVIFSNPWPSEKYISPKETIEVKINIFDNSSGVNSSTIEYSISNDKGKTWSPWTSINRLLNGIEVTIKMNLTFLNGTDNMIQWRAYDIAGNGPKKSDKYIIKVNTWIKPVIPRVRLISPRHNEVINNTYIELTWTLKNFTLHGVVYDLYLANFTPPKIFKTNITTSKFIIKGLNEGDIYYWKIIPKFGDINGSCSSGIICFKVKPINEKNDYNFEIIGPNNISLYPGEIERIILTIKNLGIRKNIIKLEIEAGNLTGYVRILESIILELNINSSDYRNLEIKLTESIPPGVYEIFIIGISLISDEKETNTHKINIEIKDNSPIKLDNKHKDSNPNLINIIILIFIIIFLIILIILFVIKRKKRLKEELFSSKTVTIKPVMHPTIVIAQDQDSQLAIKAKKTGIIRPISSQQSTVLSPKSIESDSISIIKSPASHQIPQIVKQSKLLPPQSKSLNENNTNNISKD